MKIECVKKKIEEAISITEKITGKNLTLPVLKCLLLIAKDKSLIIRSTNLDLGIEIEIPVKVSKEGVVAVPSSVLYSFINNLPDEKSIILESKDNKFIANSSHTKANINAFPYEDFPSIPVISGPEKITMNSKDLVNGLKSVWYSASSSSIKPELASIYIHNNGGEIIFAATDSFRLAEKRVNSKKTKEFDPILIPYKNVSEIIRVLEFINSEVEINLNENQISFKGDGVYLTSRLVDGVFPDYGQIIPKEHSTKTVVLKQDFINALKISNIFSNKFNQLTLNIKPKDKEFTVVTNNADIGENVYKIEGALTGEDIEANFNHKYVLDCFQSINKDSVSFELSPNKPMIIRGIGDGSFMYLVMPMNR